MAKPPGQTEQRVLLPNVDWQQFETLLTELGPERVARLTLMRDRLEMVTPTPDHERCTRLLESLILVLAEEAGLGVEAIAPALLKRPDIACAVEPNAVYYIGPHQATTTLAEHNRGVIDLTLDPPPTLVVEVAMTKSQLDKLGLYETLGIQEVWRYLTKGGDDVLKGELRFYRLHGETLEPATSSQVFPPLTCDRAHQFIEQSDSLGLQKALTLLRDWVHQ